MPTTCPQCQTENADGVKFCGDCGTKLVPPAPTTCSGCGMTLPSPPPKFCNECGTPTAPKPAPTSPSSESVPAPASASSPAPPPKDSPSGEEPTPPPVETPTAVAMQQQAPSPIAVDPATTPSTPQTPSRKDAAASVASSSVTRDRLATSEQPRPRVDTDASTATEGRPRLDTEQMSPEERVKHEEKKKKVVSVKVETVKCALCGKSVFKMEEALDSINTVFHKDCLRCRTCKAGLIGRQKVKEENRTGPLTKGQYLVAKEGSDLGSAGELFCEKHSYKATGEVVKAQVIDAPARDDKELQRVASMRKDANEDARQSMQLRVGDTTPVCSRCGQPIDKGQNVIASGLQRFHEACPSPEESAKAQRTTRFFVKKAPDRLVVTFTCDKQTRTPHTFLWDLNKDSLHESLRKKTTEDASVSYKPDAQAHMAATKKLVPPSAPAAREFDVVLKSGTNEIHPFAFKNPKDKDRVHLPKLDEATHELVVAKWHFSNGVLQSLEAKFKYDEGTKMLAPESLDIRFEMWPPEAAQDLKAELDPLKHLKERLEVSNSGVVEVKTDDVGARGTASASAPPAVGTESARGKPQLADAAAAVKPQGGGGCCVVS